MANQDVQQTAQAQTSHKGDNAPEGPNRSAEDVNRTYGSGLAGAGGTPEDYRLSGDGPEDEERTGDTNASADDLAAGDAPIAGEQGKGRGTTTAGVAGSGGDAGINAPASTSSVVSGDSTTAGGDAGLQGRDTDRALMEKSRA